MQDPFPQPRCPAPVLARSGCLPTGPRGETRFGAADGQYPQDSVVSEAEAEGTGSTDPHGRATASPPLTASFSPVRVSRNGPALPWPEAVLS